MASGWAKDGAVQDQIDDSVSDAIDAARARLPQHKDWQDSAAFCDLCDEPIPEARRKAVPGVRTCIACQSGRDSAVRHGAYNRRGSKDSQLK